MCSYSSLVCPITMVLEPKSEWVARRVGGLRNGWPGRASCGLWPNVIVTRCSWPWLLWFITRYGTCLTSSWMQLWWGFWQIGYLTASVLVSSLVHPITEKDGVVQEKSRKRRGATAREKGGWGRSSGENIMSGWWWRKGAVRRKGREGTINFFVFFSLLSLFLFVFLFLFIFLL